MKLRSIYSVYSSNYVCSVIQASCASLPNVSLRLNSVSPKATTKKILKDSTGISPQKGDLVIVIDQAPDYVFKKDAQSPHLRHFGSYSSFAAWIDRCKIHTDEE